MSDEQIQQKKDFSGFEDVGRTLDRELNRLIEFVNSRVVPAARSDAESLLRGAAEKLQAVADRVARQKQADDEEAEKAPPASESPGGGEAPPQDS